MMDFDLPKLTPETPQTVHCQVKLDDLKPTQNAAGFDEVNDKIARYSAKSKEDLEDWITCSCTRFRSSSATAATSI
jgi:hypothetical protein